MDPAERHFKPLSQRGIPILPYLLQYFRKAGLLVAIWGVGYYQFSPAWVLLLTFFSLFNEEYYRKVKFAKFLFARQSDADEREAIMARSNELPSWVFFPDVERAEWLNKMIRQMWPYIGQYVEGVLKTTVQPSVDNSLPSSLKPFKFEKIDLGSVPPRIGGIKVYVENLKRDEILLDLELLYSSDAEIKVAVRGFTAGIKTLTIQGHLRVLMKPLVNKIPIIGGMQVFFLNPPNIDFDLTNTANVLDMPLLRNTLRTIIADQISYYLVLPNKIPITLAEGVGDEIKYLLPQGVVRVHIVAARELKSADFKLVGKGKSDPYVKLFVGSRSFTTKVIKDSVNPTWNEYFEAAVDQKHGQFAELEVLDEDPGEDDELGEASIDIQNVAEKGSVDTWLPLENVETGMIHVRALWLYLSKDPHDLDKDWERQLPPFAVKDDSSDDGKEEVGGDIGDDDLNYQPTETDTEDDVLDIDGNIISENSNTASESYTSEEHLSSALLMVTLDHAKNLPRSKKSMGEPSPYAKLTIGNRVHESVPKPKTADPIWEQNFEFLIHDPRNQELQVDIIDSNKEKKRMGYVTVPLKTILAAPNMTIHRPFQVREAAAMSKLTLRLCLRILTSIRPDSFNDGSAPVKMVSSVDPDDVQVPDTPPASPNAPASPEPETVSAASQPRHNEAPVDVGEALAERNFQMGDDNVSDGASLNTTTEVRQRAPVLSRLFSSGSSRSFRSQPSDTGLGRIQITLRYSPQRSRLVCVVHKCDELIACDSDQLADPYVKIYLLPDKSSKKKTDVVKNNLNPIFDETFDWALPASEAPTRTLEITVKNEVGLFSKSRTVMGRVLIDLANFDLTKPSTDWYPLEEDEGDKSA